MTFIQKTFASVKECIEIRCPAWSWYSASFRFSLFGGNSVRMYTEFISYSAYRILDKRVIRPVKLQSSAAAFLQDLFAVSVFVTKKAHAQTVCLDFQFSACKHLLDDFYSVLTDFHSLSDKVRTVPRTVWNFM